MINIPLPRNIRIPILIPIKGRGLWQVLYPQMGIARRFGSPSSPKLTCDHKTGPAKIGATRFPVGFEEAL